MQSRTYLAIDLKSFYASVECRERDLDPLDTHLVVADETRTDKTICLAVTPSLKSYGISGRGRLFEVRQRVKQVNAERQRRASGHTFTGASYSAAELRENPSFAMDFIIAPPHMAHYMAYSSRIYAIYMKYVAPEDMVVYSIDEVFMDVTGYLETYGLTARELARKIILDVLNTTGITATAGIGTNLFLCKVAMDIVAKHVPADRDGVRIAELDERRFRHELWSYQPLTDFWRVGRGTAKKLEQYGMCTMGDIALCSEKNEDLLYKLFGKNAELLIDHAWGWEPCTVADIKAYKPSTNSISTGQVLACPYTADKALISRICRNLVPDLQNVIALKIGVICAAAGIGRHTEVYSRNTDVEGFARLRNNSYLSHNIVDQIGKRTSLVNVIVSRNTYYKAGYMRQIIQIALLKLRVLVTGSIVLTCEQKS